MRAVFVFIGLLLPVAVGAQEAVSHVSGIVTSVLSESTDTVPGIGVTETTQLLEVALSDSSRAGETVTVSSSGLDLSEGDRVILSVSSDGSLSLWDVDRRRGLLGVVAAFALAVIVFGGMVGVRALLALLGSFLVIGYVLLPGLAGGLPPAALCAVVAAAILAFAIFTTHGLKRDSLIAFLGTVGAIIATIAAAEIAIDLASLTGFTGDDTTFLNAATGGTLDIRGLFLGAVIIGVLGVLDDIGVTQVAIVRELFAANPAAPGREVFTRAMRIGREHVGALVNTIALAYAGSALPLLLLAVTAGGKTSLLVNQELFAAEIVRTAVGSFGIVLVVPVTTALAVRFLSREKSAAPEAGAAHGHHHHG